LNEKQTDERFQIFMSFNNKHLLCQRLRNTPAGNFFGGKLQNEALSLEAFRVVDVVM